MSQLDSLAINAFADRGISLGAVPQRDFAWSHDAYQKSGSDRKDIEVRICVGNYMGKVVHRETVKDVHFEDAAKVAQGILDQYREAQAQLLAESDDSDAEQNTPRNRPRG